MDTKSGNSYQTKVPIALFSRLGDVTISTDAATNQASGKIVLRGYDGSLVSFPQLTLQLGGGSGRQGPTSAFIDNNTYAMTTQDADYDRRSKLEKNGHTYRVKDHTVLASAQAAPVTLPGNPALCTCEYLTWGWWSTDTTIKSGPNAGDKVGVNMGTYVAGQPTTAIQMPQTGTATYNGFMVGNVKNGANSYIGSGNYTMNYNYGARLGGTSMQFDNRSYGGVVAGTNSSGTNFAGAFTGGGRVGSMSGSFYGPDAANQGGAFSIGTNNSNYKASGIFAGQK